MSQDRTCHSYLLPRVPYLSFASRGHKGGGTMMAPTTKKRKRTTMMMNSTMRKTRTQIFRSKQAGALARVAQRAQEEARGGKSGEWRGRRGRATRKPELHHEEAEHFRPERSARANADTQTQIWMTKFDKLFHQVENLFTRRWNPRIV